MFCCLQMNLIQYSVLNFYWIPKSLTSSIFLLCGRTGLFCPCHFNAMTGAFFLVLREKKKTFPRVREGEGLGLGNGVVF